MNREEGRPSSAQELEDIRLQLIRCGHKILGMGIKLRELANITRDGLASSSSSSDSESNSGRRRSRRLREKAAKVSCDGEFSETKLIYESGSESATRKRRRLNIAIRVRKKNDKLFNMAESKQGEQLKD